jgi:phospholipase/lecithinase/hemolysin
MLEYTTTVNTIWSYQIPYELLIANRYPGAEIVLFDVHSLMTDIYYNSAEFNNGTALNVTGYDQHCYSSGCTTVGKVDDFMWFDELHPSERTDQIIAREFVSVVEGRSGYASYWSSVEDK